MSNLMINAAQEILARDGQGKITATVSRPWYMFFQQVATLLSALIVNLATQVTGILGVGNGGTGESTLTAHAVLIGEGTSPVAFAVPGAAGTVLTSNGVGADPSFRAGASGDVAGPASSVDSEIALFDGTTGKLIKSATGTGVVHATAGVYSAAAVNLATEVTGDLPLANLTPASTGSVLLGRGASGAGDFQEIVLGTNLSMSGTTLNATGGGGGGGNSTYTGAEGSQPVANSGDLYFPNNGFYLERYSGLAWTPWGPIFPMVPPVGGAFSWVNQGGASMDTTNGGLYLEGPAGSSLNNRLLVTSAPATPYTMTAAFLPNIFATSQQQDCGLVFRDSVSGKFVTLSLMTSGATAQFFILSYQWSSPTSFAGTYIQKQYFPRQLVWFQISDDGTNRISRYSSDGQHWIQLFSVARTDFLTADQVGIYVEDQTNTLPVAMTLLSWAQT